jgi:fructose-1,6-bisphosphatase/inositol monophosphatase family enzyme
VIDPIDGSTNASRGVPWFATSLCWVNGDTPEVALVANQATGERWWAVRGEGAWRDETRVRPSGARTLDDALIGLNALPKRPFGARQVRMFGSIALDLCLVAEGTFDGYVDFDQEAHGPWDYLAGMLMVQEAGGAVADLHGRDLMVIESKARRTPVAAATPELLQTLLAARAEV